MEAITDDAIFWFALIGLVVFFGVGAYLSARALFRVAEAILGEETRDFTPEELAGIKREQEIYQKRYSQQEIDQAVERTLNK